MSNDANPTVWVSTLEFFALMQDPEFVRPAKHRGELRGQLVFVGSPPEDNPDLVIAELVKALRRISALENETRALRSWMDGEGYQPSKLST